MHNNHNNHETLIIPQTIIVPTKSGSVGSHSSHKAWQSITKEEPSIWWCP